MSSESTDLHPERITMYGAAWCIDCRRSKALLDTRKVDYDYVDLEQVVDGADRAKAISGRTQIPVVVFPDGTHMTEPTDAQLGTKLDELFAPLSPPPTPLPPASPPPPPSAPAPRAPPLGLSRLLCCRRVTSPGGLSWMPGWKPKGMARVALPGRELSAIRDMIPGQCSYRADRWSCPLSVT